MRWNTSISIDKVIAKRFFPALFIIIVALFSFLVTPGYESFTSDQSLFLPSLYTELTGTLFVDDLEPFRIMHSQLTLLNDILVFFVRTGISLVWVMFLLTVFFRTIFFTTLYMLTRYITESRTYALLALLFFLTPFFIPGTGHVTIENTFNYRIFALPLNMLYLVLTLYGRRFLALIPILLAFTVHPITTIPFLGFHYLYTGWNLWISKKNKAAIISAVLLFSIPIAAILSFLAWRDASVSSNILLRIDNAWKQLAYPRNSPAFFVFWNIPAYLSLGSWAALASIPLFYMKNIIVDAKKRTTLYIFFSIPLLMLFVAVLAEASGYHLPIKINLQRGLLFLSLFTPLLMGWFALWHADNFKSRILINGFLFSILIWFFFKDNFIFLREQMLLFIPPLIILFYSSYIPRLKNNPRLISLTAIASFALPTGAIFARSLFYGDSYSLISFFVILFSGFLIAFLYKKNILTSHALILHVVIFAIPILLLSSLLSSRTFTIYPAYSYNNSYVSACIWIQHNTSPDSIFIVEPFIKDTPEEFRLACLRPIFTTWKDGGIVPYDDDRARAFDWRDRYALVTSLRSDLTALDDIIKKYNVSYIFSESELSIEDHYPLVYANTHYYIYDIRTNQTE